MSAAVALAIIVGYALASWASYQVGREDGREDAEATARTHCATCLAGSQRRHPSAARIPAPRPATGQAAVDQWLAENYPAGWRR